MFANILSTGYNIKKKTFEVPSKNKQLYFFDYILNFLAFDSYYSPRFLLD